MQTVIVMGRNEIFVDYTLQSEILTNLIPTRTPWKMAKQETLGHKYWPVVSCSKQNAQGDNICFQGLLCNPSFLCSANYYFQATKITLLKQITTKHSNPESSYFYQ